MVNNKYGGLGDFFGCLFAEALDLKLHFCFEHVKALMQEYKRRDYA